MQRNGFVQLLRAVSAVALGTIALTSTGQAKSNITNLYTFCRDTPDSCFDGKNPTGALYTDGIGDFFGTTLAGGQNNAGLVFQLIFDADTGTRRFKRLYNFCAQSSCTDGSGPINVALIADTAGNLYGTTSGGGNGNNNGVVFMLKANASKTQYTYTQLYSFCQLHSGCEDGSHPIGGLTYAGATSGVPYDGASPLYGTTLQGGKHHVGVVFLLRPAKNGELPWVERVLYGFCTSHDSQNQCTDGKTPNGGIVVDANGNIVGTTSEGGLGNAGVAYRLTPPSSGIRWTETVLHQFCSSPNCTDGKTPLSGITIDGSGNFFGTTSAGGNAVDPCGTNGCGVVFKIDPHGIESQPYSFCSQAECADGGIPTGLALDPEGGLNGVTHVGGLKKSGTIFKLTDGTISILDYLKCTRRVCPNGTDAQGDLIVDPSGNIFGTMSQRGKFDGGTLFEVPLPE